MQEEKDVFEEPISEKEREKQLKKEYKQIKKQNHPKFGAFKAFLVALVIGVIVGAGAAYWVQNNVSKNLSEPSSVTVMFDRILKQDELVTASQKYTVVEKVKDTNRFFDLFDIPFTENSYWYRYVGNIKAAVDLSKAELVGQNGNTIKIKLTEPYISSNTPDMDESGVLEENNNLLNPIQIKDVDTYKKKCIEMLEQKAREGGLIEEAKNNAEEDLSELFSIALGQNLKVSIEWKSA